LRRHIIATYILYAAVHLAAGDDWLGILVGRPVRGAIIENEGPRAEFRRKLRRKIEAAGFDTAGRVVVLEEPWATLTLADEDHRRELALAIDEHEVDLLILGPLVSAGEFPTGGTPDEINRFEKHIGDLRGLTSRSFALWLVHHENKAGRVSGAWERLPDTFIHVTEQGNGRTHLHWQKARHASSLHGTDTTLIWAAGETYTVEEKPSLDDDTVADQILAYVRDQPGTGWSPLEKATPGVARERRRNIRDQLLKTGRLVNVARDDDHDILLDAVRERESARLHLPDDPHISGLRRDSGAAAAQSEPSAGAADQLALRPAPRPREGAGGAGAGAPEGQEAAG